VGYGGHDPAGKAAGIFMVSRRIVLYTAAALIALLLILPFILEPLINTRYVKTRIAGLIEKETGAVLGPDQMAFHLSPQPGIRLHGIALPLTRATGIKIDAVHVTLDMTQLLRGNIIISRILLEDLGAWFTPGRDNLSLNLNELFLFQFPENQINTLFDLFPDNQEHLELMVKNARTDYFTSLAGTLWISKVHQTMQFDTRILGLTIKKEQIFPSLPSEKFPVDSFASATVHLHVKLNAETGISGNVVLDQFRMRSNRLLDKEIFGSTLNFTFFSAPDQFLVRLEPTTLDYPAAQVSMAFTDDRSRQKTTLTFQGNDIDLAQARDTSLAMAPENTVVLHLFDILRNGRASDVSVTFESASRDTLLKGSGMTLIGNARKALVKIPKTNLMAEDVDGKARVINGILKINVHKGRLGSTRIHEGWLDIDLMNHRDIPFNGDFNLDVDLSEVPDMLISLLPDTILAAEMAKVRQVKGQVDARLALGLKTGQKELSVSVTTGPFSGSGNYDPVALPIDISRGIFQYENGQVRLTGFSGHIGTNVITGLTAQVDPTRDAFLTLSTQTLDINIKEILPRLILLKKVRHLLGPVKMLEGRLAIDRLHFKGPIFDPDQWTWDIFGSGRDIAVGFSTATREIHHLSGSFKTSEKSFAAMDMTAVVTNMNWVTWQISPGRAAGIALPLSVEDGSIDMGKDSISVSSHLVFGSKARVSINLTGSTPQDMKPKMVMLRHGPLTDAMVMFDWHPDTPLVRFEGKLDTRTLETLVVKDSFFYHELASLTGDVPLKIFTDNYSNLHVKTRLLHLDSLISRIHKKGRPDTKPWLAHKDIHLTADRLIYRNYAVSDLDAVIAWEQSETDIRLLSADFCGLDIFGRLTLDLNQPDLHVKTDLAIQAMDRENITPLLTCFFPNMRLMEGGYSFSAHLTGNGPATSFQNHINGPVLFESHNGQIHKMTLLSRLLSVLNILKLPDISQEGFRYNNILVNGQVKNGVIHLEKAVIDAENMALIFTGRIFPFDNNLNLTCLVAPLKTIDTIIQHIPIVNTILSGRLVSFPARATGAIDDPVITPLHPSAVGEGLINMLTSIIKVPVRLFEGTP
jgi:hypothetical protein